MDDRNQAVLTAMEPGRVYGRRKLDELFYEHTDVVSDMTIRHRLKRMVGADELEIVGIGRFKRVEDDR